jgi:hypothetical protein
LKYALHSGPNIDLAAGDRYTQFIITKCIETYSRRKQAQYDAEGRNDAGDIQIIESELELMANKIFNISLEARDHTGMIGLAIEARRIDLVIKLPTYSLFFKLKIA